MKTTSHIYNHAVKSSEAGGSFHGRTAYCEGA
ncbi:hypothetical protein RUMTOR_01465 [[Ruminococcus] torques ATCC 27756]|uniref:Uncharacterized protein n=1 Tax=[Ruminococcus] torques ATCC 27756 TaxID=411460 RepID=A5KMJ2_9FIRM|nr:hypothetical protein RUMTOR_01465 [[Ruminococcus] torques ATCC 27756]